MKPGLRRARPDDLDKIDALLNAEALPTSDLAAVRLTDFFVAEDGGEVVACIGAQVFPGTALLRSLVVAGSWRGRGLGGQLVESLERHLIDIGCVDVWLLTIDADAFFAASGFEAILRDSAPDVIRATAEFSRLCPGDAVLMRKLLRHG